ncbi:hypothetical protein [Streptomyces sp. NPDC089919]|uniref:hypothetical protein n=1 Tax=Streptomyces sp. NPDC089919 TaxID=3155188 RepID=UPI00341D800D
MVETDSGAPIVDKTQPVARIAAAERACRAQLPPPPAPRPASAERMARARAETTCMRREGVTWYPDPDPATGEFDDRGLNREQLHSLKTDHAEQLRRCVAGVEGAAGAEGAEGADRG